MVKEKTPSITDGGQITGSDKKVQPGQHLPYDCPDIPHRRQTMFVIDTPPSASNRRYCNRPPSLTPLAGHTHFANAPGFRDEVPASPPQSFAAPDGLRSYRPIGQTLLTEVSPSRCPRARCHPMRSTRGSPFRSGLLRSVTPLSPHLTVISTNCPTFSTCGRSVTGNASRSQRALDLSLIESLCWHQAVPVAGLYDAACV